MNQENINLSMENSLLFNLKPVQPDPEFIKKLRMRLIGSKNIYIEKQNYQLSFILLSVGLFIGALLVWLFRRN
mgnify:CR=1 FL=1